MAIGDDITINYTTKSIYRSASPSSTVYTMNQLYSYLQDTFDELAQMDDDVPMSAQTPTEYSLINEWHIRLELIPFLKGGGLTTNGWTLSGTKPGVRTLQLNGLTGVTEADIGQAVSGGTTGDTGILLDYDTATNQIYIRPDDNADLFDNASEVITINGDASNSATAVSTNGEVIWANPQTLGTIEADTTIYIIQNGVKLTHNWFTDDQALGKTSGHLDALIRIQDQGGLIDSGNLIFFARRYGKLYDNFPITITTGSQNAVPLSTGDDLNNTSAEKFLFYDGWVTADLTVGDVIGDNSAYASATVTSVVASVTEFVADTSGVLGITNIDGTWADGDTINLMTVGARATVNGTAGDMWFPYDTWVTADPNGTLTSSGAGAPTATLTALQENTADTDGWILCDNLSGHFYDGDTISYTGGSVDVNGSESVAVAGYSADIGVYQVCGSITVSLLGTFEEYETLSFAPSGATAVYISDNGSNSMTIANVVGTITASDTVTGDETSATANVDSTLNLSTESSTQDLNNGSGAVAYDIHIEMNKTEQTSPNDERATVAKLYEYLKYITRRGSNFTIYDTDTSAVTTIDGEQYELGRAAWTALKAAPFGTFAGGTFFGARGVWIENMATADLKSFQLIDSAGSTQTPPNSQSFVVTSVVAGDRVTVYESTGAGSLEVNKSKYTSHATNNVAGDSTIDIQETLTSDVPFGIAGSPVASQLECYIIMVAVDENEEHIYRYSSQNGASTFTLPTAITGTGDATGGGSTVTQLTDDAGSEGFQTGDLQVGDIVYDSTNGEYAYVVSIDSETQITTGGGNKTTTWLGANFETNSLVQAYNGSDTAYVPYIYKQATGTSVTETVIYPGSDRNVVVRVRLKGILPFQQANTFSSTGMSQAAIRTTDTIVTV